MPKIIPLRDLANASKLSKLVHESNEPVFVTKNGVSDLVVMSSDYYDRYNLKTNNYMISDSGSVFYQTGDNSELMKYIKQRDEKPLYTIAEIKKTLRPIFDKYKVKKAMLFGSYVKGNADSRSDIDLVVDTDLTGFKFYGLLGEITNTMRFPVDLIRRKDIHKNSEFEKEIDETGVTIYE